MTETCRVVQLGLTPYQAAWDLQRRLADEIGSGKRGATLLLLEHPHTFTFGRRGKLENLLWSQAELDRRGIAVHWVDRGGDVTYHGPGQLVGYPLLLLGKGLAPATGEAARLPRADYVGYLRKLEQVLLLALSRLGIAGERVEGKTGVWVRPSRLPFPPDDAGQPTKIAAIGVKVDARGVTQHGFAFNVQPDMSYWQGIIACGLAGDPVASLAELLQPPPAMPVVSQAIMAAFGEVFEYTMQEASQSLLAQDERGASDV